RGKKVVNDIRGERGEELVEVARVASIKVRTNHLYVGRFLPVHMVLRVPMVAEQLAGPRTLIPRGSAFAPAPPSGNFAPDRWSKYCSRQQLARSLPVVLLEDASWTMSVRTQVT